MGGITAQQGFELSKLLNEISGVICTQYFFIIFPALVFYLLFTTIFNKRLLNTEKIKIVFSLLSLSFVFYLTEWIIFFIFEKCYIGLILIICFYVFISFIVKKYNLEYYKLFKICNKVTTIWFIYIFLWIISVAIYFYYLACNNNMHQVLLEGSFELWFMLDVVSRPWLHITLVLISIFIQKYFIWIKNGRR